MEKAAGFMLAAVVLLLLAYSAFRFAAVTQSVKRCERELEELHSISRQLSLENQAMAYRIQQADGSGGEDAAFLPPWDGASELSEDGG